MSNRTVALLMLFVTALAAAGVVLAGTLRVLDGTSIGGPWMAPFVAVLSLTVTLYAGRHHILSPALANARGRAALALALAVSATLAGTLAVMWTLRWVLGSALETLSVSVPVWFALLWLLLPRPRALGTAP